MLLYKPFTERVYNNLRFFNEFLVSLYLYLYLLLSDYTCSDNDVTIRIKTSWLLIVVLGLCGVTNVIYYIFMAGNGIKFKCKEHRFKKEIEER